MRTANWTDDEGNRALLVGTDLSDAGNERWSAVWRKSTAVHLICPDPCCDSPTVIARESHKGTRHFAHQVAPTNCIAPATGGESEEHLAVKTAVAKAIESAGWSAAIERFGGVEGDRWVADVLALSPDGARAVAFEVQRSDQSPDDTRRRTERYARYGVETLWLYPADSRNARVNRSVHPYVEYRLQPHNGRVAVVSRFGKHCPSLVDEWSAWADRAVAGRDERRPSDIGFVLDRFAGPSFLHGFVRMFLSLKMRPVFRDGRFVGSDDIDRANADLKLIRAHFRRGMDAQRARAEAARLEAEERAEAARLEDEERNAAERKAAEERAEAVRLEDEERVRRLDAKETERLARWKAEAERLRAEAEAKAERRRVESEAEAKAKAEAERRRVETELAGMRAKDKRAVVSALRKGAGWVVLDEVAIREAGGQGGVPYQRWRGSVRLDATVLNAYLTAEEQKSVRVFGRLPLKPKTRRAHRG